MNEAPSTEPLPAAPGLLEHIGAKIQEYETWAKNALAHATEHIHAAPLGNLLGTLSQTTQAIANLKSAGQSFPFAEPLEQWLQTKIGAYETRILSAVESMLNAHLVELERRFPAAAEVIQAIVAQGPPDTPESPPANTPESPPASPPAASATPWPPPPDGTFPTLAEFVALGFYAETYEHQKAAWEASKAPSEPSLEPAPDVHPATETPKTSEENAPSDPATGVSSESA